MRMFLPLFLSSTLISLVASFSWESCDENASIKIDSLSLGQNESMVVQVKGSCTISDEILSPVKGELLVKKKMFWGWTKVPCINGIGSCSFDDVCGLSPYNDSCPPDFQTQGLPCKCPITKGPYGGKLSIDLKAADLPNWLETGSYRIMAKLETNSSKSLLCLKIEMTLK